MSAPHYLLLTVGSTGDLHPFLWLGQALQTLGREVTVLTHAYHCDRVRGAGLPVVGIGTDEDYLRVLRHPDLWNPKKGFAALLADYRRDLEQALQALRSVKGAAPRIAIAHPFTVPGAAIARETGALQAIVAVHLAPSSLRTCHDPLRMGDLAVPRWVPMRWRQALWRFADRRWIDPVARPPLDAVRRAQGLPDMGMSFLPHIGQAPDLTVSLFPSWFAPSPPDWPRPFIEGEFPLFEAADATPAAFSPELAAFLAAGEAPLVFTAGTGNLQASGFFACALAALARTGHRAVLLTSDRAQLPSTLPPSVLWQPYVPLAALLPRAAAVVHHGGIGTTAEALRAGTPQLVTPFAWDQFDNADRVVALGAGQSLPARRLGTRTLADRLQALTGSASVRACCAGIAARFASMPAQDPAALCREIDRRLSAAMPLSTGR